MEYQLPSEFSIDLAEETGIHIGDGSMNRYFSGKKTHWEYTYCCNAKEEKEYLDYVETLLKKLYSLNPKRESKKKDNTSLLRYFRKEIVIFKNSIGLPLGRKDGITIPVWVLLDDKFKIACVRGIFDTDGSIILIKRKKSLYPRIKISSKSKKLIIQLNDILIENNIRSIITVDRRITKKHPNPIWHVEANGISNFKKYAKTFGFSNSKHLNKYKIWKKSVGGGI